MLEYPGWVWRDAAALLTKQSTYLLRKSDVSPLAAHG
jgi:hypothetical protein